MNSREPTVNTKVFVVNKRQRRPWRSTLCIEIPGVSSFFCEHRLNALNAFLKPAMF